MNGLYWLMFSGFENFDPYILSVVFFVGGGAVVTWGKINLSPLVQLVQKQESTCLLNILWDQTRSTQIEFLLHTEIGWFS